MGHGQDSVNAGVNLGSSPRPPGGKSNRDSYRLDDFFKGGHDELVDPNSGWSIWMPSPFSPHPKDEVIADIQSRNSAIDLKRIIINDCIDWKQYENPDDSKIGALLRE